MSNTHKEFGRSWWIGLTVFLALISWMLVDVLQREGGFGRGEDVLVMGTNAGFKPFEYKQGDQVVGFDVDLAQEIARATGKQLKIEDMSFDGLLPALDSGQVDMVVAGMSVTPERAKNALFSDPYYSAAQRMIVAKGSPIRNKFQLTGRRVGVQLGTTGDTLAAKLTGVKVSQFPTAPSVLTELNAGRVDVAILDDAPAARYLTGFPRLELLPGSLSEESYAIALRKTDRQLLDKVNKVIAAMKQDGRYDNLIRKHFGTQPSSQSSGQSSSALPPHTAGLMVRGAW